MSPFQTPALSGNSSGPRVGWWGWCWALPWACPSALPAKRGECAAALSIPPPPSALRKKLWYPLCAHLCCLVATRVLVAKHPFWPTAVWAAQEFPLASRSIQAFLVKSIGAHWLQVSYRPRVLGPGGVCIFDLHNPTLGFGLWEQPRDNWLCLEFHVSGGDTAFKH